MFDKSKVKNTEWNSDFLEYLDLHPKNKYWKNFIHSKLDKLINNDDRNIRSKNRTNLSNIIKRSENYRKTWLFRQLDYPRYIISKIGIKILCSHLTLRSMPKNIYTLDYQSKGQLIEEITI